MPDGQSPQRPRCPGTLSPEGRTGIVVFRSPPSPAWTGCPRSRSSATCDSSHTATGLARLHPPHCDSRGSPVASTGGGQSRRGPYLKGAGRPGRLTPGLASRQSVDSASSGQSPRRPVTAHPCACKRTRPAGQSPGSAPPLGDRRCSRPLRHLRKPLRVGEPACRTVRLTQASSLVYATLLKKNKSITSRAIS